MADLIFGSWKLRADGSFLKQTSGSSGVAASFVPFELLPLSEIKADLSFAYRRSARAGQKVFVP